MSLVGNLEELGLGEILQIVSLGRKTGILSLSSSGGEGSVFFRQGQVVRATSNSCQQSLGEILIQKGIVNRTELDTALALQKENGFRERLGVILVTNFGVSQNSIEDVVREQIEKVVFSLFAWNDGLFRFEVLNSVETVDDTKMDPLQFMLDQGLNPQFLAMEGTRILDEARHAAEAVSLVDEGTDVEFDLIDLSPAPVSSLPLIQQPVVIVDDDDQTLRTIAGGLSENGFVVHAVTRSEDALIKVDTLYRNGGRPTVLIDLIMPKMDGSGVMGGAELLELLHNNFKDLALIVMSDFHCAEAEKKIHQLGYPSIVKPLQVEISSPAIMGSFLAKLMHVIRTQA